MLKKLSLLLLAVFTLQTISYAQNTDDVVAKLKARDQQIKELLDGKNTKEISDETRADLKALINNAIDFKEMGDVALSGVDESPSQEQLDSFYDLFAEMIRINSLKNLDIYKAAISYDGVDTSKDGKILTIKTTSTLDNLSTPVYYTMLNKDGKWVIIDFAIDGVYTAESYKNTFSRIVPKRGFDGLIKVLKKKVEKG